MIEKLFQTRQPRQWVLLVITLSVVISAWLIQSVLLPRWDDYRTDRRQVQAMADRHARLSHNLRVRREVEREYSKLQVDLIQTKSDEITLSQFLRNLQQAADRPSLTIVNMKPGNVERDRSLKTFPVKLAVAGNLQEVLGFVGALSENRDAVGLGKLSIRGTHGVNQVECSLELWMVRNAAGGLKSASPTLATAAKGVGYESR